MIQMTREQILKEIERLSYTRISLIKARAHEINDVVIVKVFEDPSFARKQIFKDLVNAANWANSLKLSTVIESWEIRGNNSDMSIYYKDYI